MADISDVSDALVDLIVKQFYPDGLAGPAYPDRDLKIYAGWPDPSQLNKDLQDDPEFPILHISVFPLPMERVTTRYPTNDEELSRPSPTFSAAISGQAVVISGAHASPYQPQNIAINIDGRAWSYRILPTDGLNQIAAALALLISDTWPGVAAVGNNVVVPAPGRIMNARVGVIGKSVREVGRQEKGFQVTLWANNHENRVWMAKTLIPQLADTTFLTLPGGSGARLTCRSNSDMDRPQAQGAFRRDLVYTVEYATTIESAAPELIVARTELKAPTGALIHTEDT